MLLIEDMPWYYAGPEAKPIGPVSLEELHARRAAGAIAPDTYVIEHTGQPSANWAWKRYSELFPASPSLPPVPPPGVPLAPPPQPPVPFAAPPTPMPVLAPQPLVVPPAPAPQALPPAQPHPLFPSAAPVRPQSPVFTSAAGPDPFYNKQAQGTNALCAWGLGLSLASFPLIFVCSIGLLTALVSIALCIAGLMQIGQNPKQAGRGMAISGLVLSALAIFLSIMLVAWFVPLILKAQSLSTSSLSTEQNSDDSN